MTGCLKMFSPTSTLVILGDESFAVHAVAASAEPSCDEGRHVGVDAFFDVMQFVRRDHLVAADAQTR